MDTDFYRFLEVTVDVATKLYCNILIQACNDAPVKGLTYLDGKKKNHDGLPIPTLYT